MRCVMTRVLPLPAPARSRTAPSTETTPSACCGFIFSRRRDKGEQTPPPVYRPGPCGCGRRGLLHDPTVILRFYLDRLCTAALDSLAGDGFHVFTEARLDGSELVVFA